MPSNSNQPLQQAQQIFNSYGQGRKIAVVAAVVGLLSSFLPWFSINVTFLTYSSSASINGWHSWALLSILAYIATGVWIILPSLNIDLRKSLTFLPPTATDDRLILGAGVVATIAVLLFAIAGGGGSVQSSVAGFSQGLAFGGFIGLLCAIAIAVGGYLMRKETAPDTTYRATPFNRQSGMNFPPQPQNDLPTYTVVDSSVPQQQPSPTHDHGYQQQGPSSLHDTTPTSHTTDHGSSGSSGFSGGGHSH